MKIVFGVFLLLCLNACRSVTFESLSDTDKVLVQSCVVCHNKEAKVNRGPQLDGMGEDYFIEQIENFRQGKRGYTEADKLMVTVAKSLEEEKIKVLATYFKSQPVTKVRHDVSGDLVSGEKMYEENCRGCHSKAIGRFFTGSPVIEQLEFDYIFKQLQDFRDEKRGFVQPDKHKEKMIIVAKRFNDQQFKDIVAYIESQK